MAYRELMQESILNQKELNVENFESAIAVGFKPANIFVMFNTDERQMDEWCKNVYGHTFRTTFDMVRQCTYQEFLGVVKQLGYRGNPSALNIINNALNQMASDNVVKIVFDNNVELEKEKDNYGDE